MTYEPEIYEYDKHFAMVDSWGEPLDPRSLGVGLVIPDLCCCFMDQIGRTNAAFFYSMRANEEKPSPDRIVGICLLRERLVKAALDTGICWGVTSTKHPVVFSGWKERMGWEPNGEMTLKGMLT